VSILGAWVEAAHHERERLGFDTIGFSNRWGWPVIYGTKGAERYVFDLEVGAWGPVSAERWAELKQPRCA
jgi:hypothetical protein